MLERLGDLDLEWLLECAEAESEMSLPLTPGVRGASGDGADGDGRALLNPVEQVAAWDVPQPLDIEALSAVAAARGEMRQIGG